MPRARQETKQLNVRVPRDVYEALRTYAYAADTTINDAVVRALLDFLASKGREEQVGAFLKRARTQYRTTLDKLADL
ncbi:MAG: DNA-binding protein [Actinomycetota bacterium]